MIALLSLRGDVDVRAVRCDPTRCDDRAAADHASAQQRDQFRCPAGAGTRLGVFRGRYPMALKGEFELKSWDEKAFVEGNGEKLTHASVTQHFTGDVKGDGSVEWLMCYRPDGTA